MRKLLRISLDGLQYGVWKEDILSMEAQTIHWLPGSGDTASAIAIIRRRTVTLADLSAYITLAPIRREQKALVLLLPEQDKVAGFMIEGEVEQLQISSDAVYPMPDYLRTPIVDSCALSGSALIPVINIQTLRKYARSANYTPAVSGYRIIPSSQQPVSAQDTLRVFASSGRVFAAVADNIEQKMVPVSSISKLALTPPQVRGITLHNKKVLPVIDLAQQMHQPVTGQQEMMLVTDMAGQGIGFLVDSDIGELPGKRYTVSQLPLPVRSDWLRLAAIRGNRVIPIVDLEVLLAARPDTIEDKPDVRELSAPSPFQSRFDRQDVKIVEFSLMGALHALPELEVEDSFPFKSILPIPNGDILAAGVVLHEGHLLPVIDLARCFGRQSKPTADWHFILVRNNEFRVLIMTDTVVDAQTLPVDMQRDLPFVSSNSVVYGCYPAENGVRLILNIEALTVYFDEEHNQEFISSLSKE